MDLPKTIEIQDVNQESAQVVDDFQLLDPRKIVADRMSNLITLGVVGLAALIGLTIFSISIERFGPIWWIVILVSLGAYSILAVAAIVWPPVEFRCTRWRLDPAGFQIRRGVIWRHQISVPVARVQHTDISQGPIERFFELGTLTVNTAGTENASVALGGLSHQVAIELRDELVRQRKAIDVV